jgi:hypothetical protein
MVRLWFLGGGFSGLRKFRSFENISVDFRVLSLADCFPVG